jgi:hypothetical protein
MIVEYEAGKTVRMVVDFVVPTQALRLIREGARNGLDLLEEAGLATDEAEAEAELKRIEAS